MTAQFISWLAIHDEPMISEDAETGKLTHHGNFTGIRTVGQFDDGRRFVLLLPATLEILGESAETLEAKARDAVENMRPEDIVG